MVSLDAIINERGFTCAIIELLETLGFDNLDRYIEIDEDALGYDYYCTGCGTHSDSFDFQHKEDCQAVVLTQVIAEYKKFMGC